ncbi:hypothetical protein EJ03DRAFT_301576 [Teratosphaeria nubilosa]|uniref:Prephenate dehydrogenase [NADP(+)] n=1 Tax=Teratosphaeria nubilosa TaxID=161662 RepID=A0A6G1KWX9_9PEZI|nr:hypothetical protein EJ03DRAFT_301576 [Teratosphaeria nubilosa]
MADAVVGIIGMGDMGKMYARALAAAGWKVHASDLPDKTSGLREEFACNANITVLDNGQLVSRSSDWIMYSVEAKHIASVVAHCGPSTKLNAVVGGQTSTKAPEIAAFEAHLPPDIEIVTCHSLHGPKVNPKGQPLAIIPHRVKHPSSITLVEDILSCLESNYVRLTAEQHDRITADTQAVTHAAFLSMGAAWHANNQFPWEIPRYIGGVENVKINLMFRIYSNKWHVYAGLAILNPAAKAQIRQYAESVSALFKLMLAGDREGLRSRILTARDAVFGRRREGHEQLLLQDELLDRFSLGEKPATRVKNNHLSLLAMVDCWWKLGIVPYDHMICSTPLFRLWLGITEYVFRTSEFLDECIDTAIADNTFRADDLEFTFGARDWSERVDLGNMVWLRQHTLFLLPFAMPCHAMLIWFNLPRTATARNSKRFKSTLSRGSRRRRAWGMK